MVNESMMMVVSSDLGRNLNGLLDPLGPVNSWTNEAYGRKWKGPGEALGAVVEGSQLGFVIWKSYPFPWEHGLRRLGCAFQFYLANLVAQVPMLLMRIHFLVGKKSQCLLVMIARVSFDPQRCIDWEARVDLWLIHNLFGHRTGTI